MRPQQQRSFATSSASKLDRLEVVAALLERDATNGRALYAEMGATLVPVPAARSPRWARTRSLAGRGHVALRQTAISATAIMRSRRLRTALRATFDFVADFLVVLAVGCTVVVALAAAFALTALLG